MKKFISLALAGTMAISLLAGCTQAPAPTQSSSPAATQSSAPAATPEKTAEPVELIYWSMWNNTEPQAVAIQEAADAYSKKTGNTVKIEWKGRDLKKVIQTSLEAGEKIDLFDADFMIASKQLKDLLLPLDDMAKAVNYDSFAIPSLPAAVRGWAGNLVCIPYQPFTSGVFYNKAAFAAAKIEKDPQTWAEFLDVCEKLKTAGYIPLAQDDAYVIYAFGFHLARYIGQDGVKALVTEGLWAETPEVLKAANDISNLKAKGYLSPTAPDAFPDGENEIGMDKTAMIVNASWIPGEVTNNTGCDLEWGMFNYPTTDGGKDSNTIANVGAQSMAISKKSANPQAAFDFIMTVTSGEFDQKMATTSNGIPADTRNTEWPALLASCREPFNALTSLYDWNMGFSENADIQEVLKAKLNELFGGKITGEQFVAAMEAVK